MTNKQTTGRQCDEGGAEPTILRAGAPGGSEPSLAQPKYTPRETAEMPSIWKGKGQQQGGTQQLENRSLSFLENGSLPVHARPTKSPHLRGIHVGGRHAQLPAAAAEARHHGGLPPLQQSNMTE